MGDSSASVTLTPLNKDIDVLPGYERKQLRPSQLDVLEQQVSVNEAFDQTKTEDLFQMGHESISSGSLQANWTKFKNFCLASFQTRASDFAKTEQTIVFSKQVRDRLAELEVSTDEAQMITLMQQNEEKLRNEIKKQSKELERLHANQMHWEMIELISKACQLLINTKSPQFYPAQFMLVLELVECFGKMVHDRIASHKNTKGDFLIDQEGTVQLLALNWSMILCRTSKLLPRLLLQIAFLRCVKFHPFKTTDEAISQIINAIPGLGTASSGIYVRSYLLYTIFTNFPETSCDIILPLFTSYSKSLLHLKNGGFKRQFNISADYTFNKYIETHGPALHFFLSVMISTGDPAFLKECLDEFYQIGQPSSFILAALIDELPVKFVGKIYPVLLMLIDKSDDVVPHPTLINKLVIILTRTDLKEGVVDLMNDIWSRMREWKNVEDFVFVASPMTRFIAKFCQPHYTNLFLTNVVSLLRQNFASTKDKSGRRQQAKPLSKKLADCVTECIIAAVESGKHFSEVLAHVSIVVDLMDFLTEESLVNVSRVILNDVSVKPFELTDPLCIRILLELSTILFQSLSVLSPVDVIEKTNKVIEWFLCHVDFGMNIEAHLNFLLTARMAFPTGNRLLAAIAKIALRLTTVVYAKKVKQYDTIAHTLLAFAYVTIPSVTDISFRAELYMVGAKVALVSNVVCFAHSYFDEFCESIKQISPGPVLYSLYMEAFTYLLIMPAKPDHEDPFYTLRTIMESAIKSQWPDDEPVRLALEALIIMSHSQRSEYVIRVEGVDSNDVLFAGSEEFKQHGIDFVNTILPKLILSLQRFRKKSVIAARNKVPILALKAMNALADCYKCDEELIKMLNALYSLTSEGNSPAIKELKASTLHHLSCSIGSNDLGREFLQSIQSE